MSLAQYEDQWIESQYPKLVESELYYMDADVVSEKQKPKPNSLKMRNDRVSFDSVV